MQQQDRQDPALAAASEVEQVADSLSEAADALHARIMRAIRKRPLGGAAPAGLELALTQAEAQTMFDTEVGLRQQANQLYLDAANHALQGLEASQRSVLELVDATSQKIARVNHIKDLIGIGTDLLNLVGGILAHKPEHIASALEKMRNHLGDAKKNQAPPPS